MCLESRDVITFPSSINPNMQMNALLNFNISHKGTFNFSFMGVTVKKKKKKEEKEMAKTNKNTHNAPV